MKPRSSTKDKNVIAGFAFITLSNILLVYIRKNIRHIGDLYEIFLSISCSLLLCLFMTSCTV